MDQAVTALRTAWGCAADAATGTAAVASTSNSMPGRASLGTGVSVQTGKRGRGGRGRGSGYWRGRASHRAHSLKRGRSSLTTAPSTIRPAPSKASAGSRPPARRPIRPPQMGSPA